MIWLLEWPTLSEWAAQSVDMVPHTDQLTALAAQSSTVLEFGVRSGVSTLALLRGLPDDGTLTSVDIDPAITSFFHPALRADGRFTLLLGSDQSPTVRAHYPERIDLLMIDASHTYEDTVAELRIGADLGATRIALHDYLYGEVEPLCHVKEAVDEFVAEGGYAWEALHPSRWGLAVLRRV